MITKRVFHRREKSLHLGITTFCREGRRTGDLEKEFTPTRRLAVGMLIKKMN